MNRRFKVFLALLVGALAQTSGHAQGVHPWYDDAQWKQSIHGSIDSFFGSHVGTYVGDGLGRTLPAPSNALLISHQFLTVFFGVPAGKELLSGGRVLYAFSKPHDGLIKAVAVTRQGDTALLATAFMHYSCGTLDPSSASSASALAQHFAPPCNQSPVFTIFYRTPADKDALVTEDLLAWARRKSPQFKFEVVILN